MTGGGGRTGPALEAGNEAASPRVWCGEPGTPQDSWAVSPAGEPLGPAPAEGTGVCNSRTKFSWKQGKRTTSVFPELTDRHRSPGDWN